MKPGTRVRMTPEAIRQGLQGRVNRRTGVCLGWKPDDKQLILVRRDGEKRAEAWSKYWWEADE